MTNKRLIILKYTKMYIKSSSKITKNTLDKLISITLNS